MGNSCSCANFCNSNNEGEQAQEVNPFFDGKSK